MIYGTPCIVNSYFHIHVIFWYCKSTPSTWKRCFGCFLAASWLYLPVFYLQNPLAIVAPWLVGWGWGWWLTTASNVLTLPNGSSNIRAVRALHVTVHKGSGPNMWWWGRSFGTFPPNSLATLVFGNIYNQNFTRNNDKFWT